MALKLLSVALKSTDLCHLTALDSFRCW